MAGFLRCQGMKMSYTINVVAVNLYACYVMWGAVRRSNPELLVLEKCY